MDGQLVNSGKWADETGNDTLLRYDKAAYERNFATKGWREELIAQWGSIPGTVMTEGERFLIPGMLNGNLFIGLQPTRGIHEHPESVYHDGQLPPPHQYAAFYQWLREEFSADAIIHIGTHGTLEFLPGKENGMSKNCFPDQFVSDLPHFYYYYVGNSSEGMIAKRRSHATLLSYHAPPFVEGELYGEYAALERLIHEYRDAKQMDSERCATIWEQIKELARQLEFKPLRLEGIEQELYRMQRSLIPQGLHVLGQGFSCDDATKYMSFVLRHDRADVPSLRRLLARDKELDYDRLLTENDTERLAHLDEMAERAVKAFLQSGEIPEAEYSVAAELKKTLNFGKRAYEAALSNNELEALLHGLNGTYIPVKLAGDVMRYPEILPTGRNMYQLDPRDVPSESAIKRGEEIARRTISLYYSDKRKYPETTAIILWGIETARTQGETIGQILHYLGVRLGSQKNRFQTIYEIIPLAELSRPRLNVVVNISGVFRDMFPTVVEELHELFQRVAQLDEPEENNFFKRQTNQLYIRLLKDGYPHDEAFDLACARIFGPAEGEYGTGISKMIETKNWSDEEQLGAMYNQSVQHMYSNKHHGQKMEKLFQSHLEAIDIVSQLRSNHEYEMIDIDDYYGFFWRAVQGN